jgi:hypothetical protein
VQDDIDICGIQAQRALMLDQRRRQHSPSCLDKLGRPLLLKDFEVSLPRFGFRFRHHATFR